MSKELEIAVRYFINELQPDALKLQKLLYFAQGISYCMNDEEFFEEEFEAWVHGPVIPAIYRRYRDYGYNHISINYSIGPITEQQENVLKYVKDTYGKYDGFHLEKMTHSQEPWIYARSGLDPDERDTKEIPKEIIAEYFIGLMFQPCVEEWTN